ncbi:MAG: GNAT family N-acetyltransferase [Anaerolineaceae bacterium]
MTAPAGSLELMRLQVRNLFRFDDVGRLVSTNETPPFSAPRLFLGRTVEGNAWHLRHDLPAEQAEELTALLGCEPPLGEAGAEPHCLARAIVVLGRDQPVTAIHRGPAFVFESAPDPSAGPLLLGPGDLARFHPQLREMGWTEGLDESQQPCFGVEADGAIVALCHSSRLSVDAAAAGVSTAPDYRRRGFARRTVEAWAAAVIASGRIALYSTTWDNAASRAIADGLGLRFFGEDCHIT